MANAIRKCSIENCDKPIQARKRCMNHYYQWRLGNNASCSITGCHNPSKARGWCSKHYTRWQIHGNPTAGRARHATPEESFADRTKKQGDCIIWTGAEGGTYGQIYTGGRMVYAHRYAWEQKNGPIKDGVHIDHTCWNHLCVNTDHLRLATPQQNTQSRRGANPRSASGVRNVHRKRNAWQVRIKKDGVSYGFGTYPTVEEASRVAEQARKSLFGDFAGRG